MGVRVSIAAGCVEGAVEKGVTVFRGIPYAAPPFGAQRFRPPVPPARWEGVRPATEVSPGLPQPRMDELDDLDARYFNPATQAEDSLTLDIWTPDVGAGSLPVMVWIHGGAYMIGSGSAPGYGGRTFARDGVVHVSINYRLGVEGFIYLGDDTDNLGLRDQVAALEWVQSNIGAFGGDPENVTIFGQSAGGVSIMMLLAMPAAKGLFVRAIAQSGCSMASVSTGEASAVTKRLAKRLGVLATREGIAGVSVERTVAQTLPLAMDFANPLKRGAKAFMISPFRAVHGTPSLPDPPLTAATRQSAVPLLTGTMRNETTLFLGLLGRLDHINPLLARYLTSLMRVGRRTRNAYREGPRHLTNGLALVEAAWTDWGFRMPTIKLVEARNAPSYLYEFRWASPKLPAGLGSVHSLENSFVRDDFATLRGMGKEGEQLIGANPPQELATVMHAAWVRFATTGDPGWAAYEPKTRQTMVFDTHSEVITDAAAPERLAWAGRR